MPKIIENLNDTILDAARKRLLSQDDKNFTMRQISQDCSVALGTIYNYYESKDQLVFNVLLRDWRGSLKSAESQMIATEDIIDALKILYYTFGHYFETYLPTMIPYYRKETEEDNLTQDKYLLNEIEQIVKHVLDKRSIFYVPNMPHFLSTLLLVWVIRGESFEANEIILRKILN